MHEVIELFQEYGVGNGANSRALAELQSHLGSDVRGLKFRIIDNLPTDSLTVLVGSGESPQYVKIRLGRELPQAFHDAMVGIGSRIPHNPFRGDTQSAMAVMRKYTS